jgi:hypothetical protein
MTGLKITDLEYITPQDITGNDVIPIVDTTMDTLRQMRVSDFKSSLLTGVTISNNFSAITNTPTTLSGYGITDTYTIRQIDLLLQAYSPNITYAGTTSDGMLYSTDWVIFNNKADKSNTLSGYGITNAYTKTEIDTTLGTYTNTMGLTNLLSTKQDELINQQNIKSINGVSILGTGDLTITSGGTSIITYEFTATDGQMVFTLPVNITSGAEVFVNGVLQLINYTYIVSSTTITFLEGLSLNSTVTIVNGAALYVA